MPDSTQILQSDDLEELISSFMESPVTVKDYLEPEESEDQEDETLEDSAFSLVDSRNPPSVIPEGFLEDSQESKIAYSETERDILEYTLKGHTPDLIAVQLALPKSYVRSFLLKKEVKDYLRELKEAKSQLLQLRALDIYSKIVDSRIATMEENGEDFSSLTNKDTIDVLRSAVELASGIDKARQSAQEGDVYVSILQQVTK